MLRKNNFIRLPITIVQSIVVVKPITVDYNLTDVNNMTLMGMTLTLILSKLVDTPKMQIYGGNFAIQLY